MSGESSVNAGEEADVQDEAENASGESVSYPHAARYVAPLLAWLFPGAGHFYLNRRGKALCFLALVAFSCGMGFSLDGKLYTPEEGDLFSLFGAYACLGLGPAYFLLRLAAFSHGDPFSPWAEYGNRFLLTGGIMNLLLMLDAFDVAIGRKGKSL